MGRTKTHHGVLHDLDGGWKRNNVEASLNQPFDNRTTWDLNRHGDAMGLSFAPRPPSGGKLGQTSSIMIDDLLSHHLTVGVKHTDLMVWRAPIGFYKPVVSDGMIMSC